MNPTNVDAENIGSPELSELFASIRSSTSQESKEEAIEAIARILEYQPVHLREESALFLIQEVVLLGRNEALDHAIVVACGPWQALSACSITLHHLCQVDMKSPCALQTSLRIIRKILLSISTSKSIIWVDRLLTREQQTTSHTVTVNLERFVGMAVLFPLQIANSCHRQKVVLPLWAVRSRFLAKLVESALQMTLSLPESEVALLYTKLLFTKLVRGGAYDEVTMGLFQFYGTQKPENQKLSTNLLNIINTIKSPREMSLLLSSILKHQISLHQSSTATVYEICKELILPYLQLVCTPTLERNKDFQDSWVQATILSRSFISSDSPTATQMISHTVALVLASCAGDLTDNDDSSDDEEDKEILTGPFQVLQRQIGKIAFVWSERTFVHQSDMRLQRLATTFISTAFQLLPIQKEELTMRVMTTLMRGVSLRLESSITHIRRDGMIVAEVIAKRLEQDLHFEELDGHRDDDMDTARKFSDDKDHPETFVSLPPHIHSKKGRKRKPVDPDEVYVSSEGEGTEDSSIENCLSDEDRSIWDDDLIPYDLEDEEDDLRPTPRPLFLRDCLRLFRIEENDENGPNQQEMALQQVEPLVRAKPMDLHDLAVPLTRELLRLQDLFNIDNFDELRIAGLIALTVHQPVLVGECIIQQLFCGDWGLSVRLDILHTIENASHELCGAKSMATKKATMQAKTSSREERPGMYPLTHKLDLVESRTRRWRSVRNDNMTIANRFGQVSPIWFYALINGFMKSREDPKLWGGANGARLLSTFLLTLATIVECAGLSIGAEDLSKDLIEFSWSFRSAEVAEIRSSVLLAIASSLALLSNDVLLGVLYGGTVEDIPDFVRRTALDDSDMTCRRLAVSLSRGIQEGLCSDPLATTNAIM